MPSSSEQTVSSRSIAAWIQFVLVLLPAVAAYAILARFYTSVPIIDDYPELFVFAIDFRHASGLLAKLGLLFTAQVGPYKLFLDHALVAMQLCLFGRMNFPMMIVLGNLTLLGIFAIFWMHTDENHSPTRDRLLLLLPVSLLVFSMNYAETLDWAMIGLQHPAVILFSLAALHFLVKQHGRAFLCACAFGLLASSASANGLLLWPVGLLYLLMHDRSVVKLAGWCGAIVLTALAYFLHFQPALLSAHASIGSKLAFLAMFCGGAMENMHHRPLPYVSVAIGLGVLVCFFDAVRTRFDRRNPFFFFAAVWLMMTAFVVANARAGMGVNLSLSSRYKIFCDMLLVFCYVYLLDRWQRRAQPLRGVVGMAVAASLVVGVGGDFAGAKLLALRKARADSAMRAYLAAPQSASPMFVVEDSLNPDEVQEEENARRELNEAIRLGIYTPPVF